MSVIVKNLDGTICPECGQVCKSLAGLSKHMNALHKLPSVCKQAGEKLDNPECIEQGECSWFRHSQDTYRLHGIGDNYPPGYDGSLDE